MNIADAHLLSPSLTLQPHPRCIAVGELDASGFQCGLEFGAYFIRDIFTVRGLDSLHGARMLTCALGEFGTRPIEQGARGTKLFNRDRSRLQSS